MKPFEYSLVAVVGSLSFFIIFIVVSENPNATDTQDYDPKYTHLISRNVDAVISKSTKFDPSRTCFEVSDENQKQFSRQFVDSVIKASMVYDSTYDPQYGVGFQLSGVSFKISPQDAVDYLRLYDFKEKVIGLQKKDRQQETTDMVTSIIHYNCFFDYKGVQYLFQLDFDPMIPPYEKFNQINITKNEQGQPVLVNANIVAYLDFNDTTVFNNQLNEDVTLVFPILKPKKDHGYSPDSITIPAHMSFAYYFRNYYAGGKIPYVYTIQPLGLHGSVLVKNPDYCMSMDEARSIYSHKDMEIRYPTYLPPGYKYGCTAMVTTREVLIGYDKSGILAKDMEFLTHYKKRIEYLQKGGIVIDFYLMNDAKRDCENELEPAGPIGEGIAVYADSSKFEGATTNLLRLCTDNEVYNINGELSKDELIKMMKSVYE